MNIKPSGVSFLQECKARGRKFTPRSFCWPLYGRAKRGYPLVVLEVETVSEEPPNGGVSLFSCLWWEGGVFFKGSLFAAKSLKRTHTGQHLFVGRGGGGSGYTQINAGVHPTLRASGGEVSKPPSRGLGISAYSVCQPSLEQAARSRRVFFGAWCQGRLGLENFLPTNVFSII